MVLIQKNRYVGITDFNCQKKKGLTFGIKLILFLLLFLDLFILLYKKGSDYKNRSLNFSTYTLFGIVSYFSVPTVSTATSSCFEVLFQGPWFLYAGPVNFCFSLPVVCTKTRFSFGVFFQVC